MPSSIVITSQFRGPPNSGNGGYVCGLLAGRIDGPATVVLRAPIPLDTPMLLDEEDGAVHLAAEDGTPIGEAKPADASGLPHVPAPPALPDVAAAALRFPGLEHRFHPVCFTCGDQLDEGFGLRVFTGQVERAEAGLVAGPWTVRPEFVGEDGFTPPEIVWAALDCPGSVAWVASGGGAGLLGTMTGEILLPPGDGRTHHRPRLAHRAERPQAHLGHGALLSRRRTSGPQPTSLDHVLAAVCSGVMFRTLRPTASFEGIQISPAGCRACGPDPAAIETPSARESAVVQRKVTARGKRIGCIVLSETPARC